MSPTPMSFSATRMGSSAPLALTVAVSAVPKSMLPSHIIPARPAHLMKEEVRGAQRRSEALACMHANMAIGRNPAHIGMHAIMAIGRNPAHI